MRPLRVHADRHDSHDPAWSRSAATKPGCRSPHRTIRGQAHSPCSCCTADPAAHDYLDSLTGLAGPGRAVVHYDQLGSGRGTHLPDADRRLLDRSCSSPSSTTCSTLGIAELPPARPVLGRHARRRARRAGNARVCVPLDRRLAGVDGAVAGGAAELRAAAAAGRTGRADRHEEAGTSPRSTEATRVLRPARLPDPLAGRGRAPFAEIDDDPTVYHAMNGPNEFHVVGSLKDWTHHRPAPPIAVPTLLIAGRYDEATPATLQPYADGIADVRGRSSRTPATCPTWRRRTFRAVVGVPRPARRPTGPHDPTLDPIDVRDTRARLAPSATGRS